LEVLVTNNTGLPRTRRALRDLSTSLRVEDADLRVGLIAIVLEDQPDGVFASFAEFEQARFETVVLVGGHNLPMSSEFVAYVRQDENIASQIDALVRKHEWDILLLVSNGREPTPESCSALVNTLQDDPDTAVAIGTSIPWLTTNDEQVRIERSEAESRRADRWFAQSRNEAGVIVAPDPTFLPWSTLIDVVAFRVVPFVDRGGLVTTPDGDIQLAVVWLTYRILRQGWRLISEPEALFRFRFRNADTFDKYLARKVSLQLRFLHATKDITDDPSLEICRTHAERITVQMGMKNAAYSELTDLLATPIYQPATRLPVSARSSLPSAVQKFLLDVVDLENQTKRALQQQSASVSHLQFMVRHVDSIVVLEPMPTFGNSISGPMVLEAIAKRLTDSEWGQAFLAATDRDPLERRSVRLVVATELDDTNLDACLNAIVESASFSGHSVEIVVIDRTRSGWVNPFGKEVRVTRNKKDALPTFIREHIFDTSVEIVGFIRQGIIVDRYWVKIIASGFHNPKAAVVIGSTHDSTTTNRESFGELIHSNYETAATQPSICSDFSIVHNFADHTIAVRPILLQAFNTHRSLGPDGYLDFPESADELQLSFRGLEQTGSHVVHSPAAVSWRPEFARRIGVMSANNKTRSRLARHAAKFAQILRASITGIITRRTPDARSVLIVGQRYEHHASKSGYERCYENVGSHIAGTTQRWSNSPFVAKFEYALCERSGNEFYSLAAFVAELRALYRLARKPYVGIHQIYADTDAWLLPKAAEYFNFRYTGVIHLPGSLLNAHNRIELFRQHSVVVVCESYRETLRPRISDERIVYIPIGVDSTFFHPTESMPKGVYALCVGAHLRDFDLLFSIWSHVERNSASKESAANAPLPRLVVVGCPEEVIRSSKLYAHERVEFADRKTDRELRKLYQEAKAVILPFQEPTASTAMLEALASGAPIITNDLAPTREYLGPFGVFVADRDPADWAEQVERVLRTPMDPLLVAGRAKHAAKFDFTQIQQRVRDLYGIGADERVTKTNSADS
jgi:glycosyltransferase involved in cell wall biosynthesis